ncbi:MULTISPECIES: acyl carrier protein [Vibrio]|jgi:acyl carrier protein|uniref:Carrier domain-containing protein n=1 Tax=Vibrio campbellii (strain ATCC BAA-1116) TaxID=2902295 RepID=A7MSN2_VIBC1|nr:MULTISPECIES: acyl carrier protein [Vibrio]KIP78731.1 hypothetical protein SN11_06435 [Vibrio harveyi]ABU69676.1 hypothetical protein VIBHAR_00674 [Vibrio campbellii ATCC BAA-1116]AGU96601.1 hypothetical protein M892_09480 [Vibrio campbellii ATCC BAA-1116]AQM68262.1 acyl carrier protein [Vibrio campbellii]KIF46918.1 hypothetical protein M445_14590 [Vibrio owensii 47666-1]
MNEGQVIELVKEVLVSDLDEITLETELNEDNWDSLAVVTFIALVNEKYDVVFPADKAIMAETVKDLLI